MAAITISRQLGSLGCVVAEATAQRLGYRLVWREMINQAALRAGKPELALAAIDELGLLGLCPSAKDCHAYRAALEQVVQELAGEGNVLIMGRAGQMILRGRPDVLHVKLVAPEAVRIERIANRHHIPLERARAQVEASDRHRQTILRRLYQVRWDNPDLYDLMINTAQFTPEAAAGVICEALAARLKIETLSSPVIEEAAA